jgi:hypothetical protein
LSLFCTASQHSHSRTVGRLAQLASVRHLFSVISSAASSSASSSSSSSFSCPQNKRWHHSSSIDRLICPSTLALRYFSGAPLQCCVSQSTFFLHFAAQETDLITRAGLCTAIGVCVPRNYDQLNAAKRIRLPKKPTEAAVMLMEEEAMQRLHCTSLVVGRVTES